MCAHFLFCFSGAEDESYGHMGSRIWLCLWVMSSANLEYFISIRIYWFICIFFFLSCLLCFLCHTHSVQMTCKSLVILKKSCQSERMHFWSLLGYKHSCVPRWESERRWMKSEVRPNRRDCYSEQLTQVFHVYIQRGM